MTTYTLSEVTEPMQRHLILAALSVAATLHAMAFSSVSVVLPQMQGSLSAAPDQISWVLTLAVVGAVVATPLSGWLADRLGWRRVLFITMLAYAACWVVFILWPVAGPNHAFDHPTGPVREVWSARLVYSMLESGSSFGAAFPSSHVAATVAAVGGLWREWRALGMTFAVPTALLVIGTVYCQMHYAIDAVAGLLVAAGAVALGSRASTA